MSWTRVQNPAVNAKYNTYSGTNSVSFASSPAIGSVIVVTGGGRSSSVNWDVTDNYGNGPSAHYVIRQTGNSQPYSAFVALVVVTNTGAGFTVTATATSGEKVENLKIDEFSGGSGAGVEDAYSLGSYQLNVPTTASVTTTEAGDLLISSFVDSNAVTLTIPPSGYTSMMAVSTDVSGHGSAYKIAGAAGSETVTWPEYSGTGYTRAVLVALKAGASGPTVTGITGTTATEASAVVFTVSMSGTGGLTDAYSWSGTAGAGDYTTTLTDGMFTTTGGSGSVTVSGGNIVVPSAVTAFTVTVPTTTDTIDEADETIRLVFGGVTASSGTITDDDAAPTISVNDVTESAGSCIFTVSLSAASGKSITVDYATANGTSTAGVDYTAASGTLTFAAGETTKTVTVTVP